MKTITIKAYTAKELQEEFPRGFERAHSDYKEDCYNYGVAWGNEIMESLKAVFKNTDGVYLRDWSINDQGGSYLRLAWNQDEAEDLQGTRAQAWLENNLLYKLRIDHNSPKRWELSKYGSYYRAGMIKPCPFTGVCFDEDYLESLQKDIKDGYDLGESFYRLADVAGRLMSDEWESQLSEEYFIDHADANEWLYSEDGKRVD